MLDIPGSSKEGIPELLQRNCDMVISADVSWIFKSYLFCGTSAMQHNLIVLSRSTEWTVALSRLSNLFHVAALWTLAWASLPKSRLQCQVTKYESQSKTECDKAAEMESHNMFCIQKLPSGNSPVSKANHSQHKHLTMTNVFDGCHMLTWRESNDRWR